MARPRLTKKLAVRVTATVPLGAANKSVLDAIRSGTLASLTKAKIGSKGMNVIRAVMDRPKRSAVAKATASAMKASARTQKTSSKPATTKRKVR